MILLIYEGKKIKWHIQSTVKFIKTFVESYRKLYSSQNTPNQNKVAGTVLLDLYKAFDWYTT